MLAPADFSRENAGGGMSESAMEQPDFDNPNHGTFESLVEEYADRVYNIALRITGNAADAEDAMQEAFLSAFRAWSTFRGEASPKTWLYRVATNAALMRVRQRRPVQYLSDLVEEEDVADWSASVVELAQSSELREHVLQGISLLEPDLRAALVLRDIDGLSTSEAADALDISEQALKSRLHRARMLLRQFLSDYFRDR
jgi:RNA polymerase sigma-70 factor (ECF subfamily)